MKTWNEAIHAAVSSKKLANSTKEGYAETLQRHRKFLGSELTDAFSEDAVLAYGNMCKQLGYLNDDTNLRNGSVRHMFSAMKRLYRKNLVNITDAQYRTIGDEYVGRADLKENRGYRDYEILTMLDSGFAGPRARAMIFLASGSGLREDPISRLTFGHLKQVVIDGKAYPNYWIGPIWSKSRWLIVCSTEEFFHEIDKYRKLRERFGEVIYDKPIREDKGEKVDFKKQSPLFRNESDLRQTASMDNKMNEPKAMTKYMVYKSLERVAKLCGVREIRPNQEDKTQMYVSSAVHGFRGYFETVMINVNDPPMRETLRKILMGHATGIEHHYYDPEHEPSKRELFKEYLKAQPALIIYKDKLVIKDLKQENIQLKNQRVEDQTIWENRFKGVLDTVGGMKDVLDKIADKEGIDVGEN